MVNVVDQRTQQTSISPSIRHATRSRVSDMLQKKLEGKLDHVSKERFEGLIKMIDDKLMEMAKYSESRYSDLVDLDNRVKDIWNEFTKSVSRKHACPPTSSIGDTSNTVNNLPNAASLQSGRSIPPTNYTNGGGSSFSGIQQISAGFSIGSGDSVFNRTANNLPNASLQSGSIPNHTSGGSLGNESQRVSAGFSFGSGDNGFNRTANNLPNSTLQSGSIPPTNYTNGGSSFSGIQQVSAGFPNDSGLYKTANIDQSLYTDGIRVSAIGSDLQRHQTPGANVQMVDVYRSNNIHQNQTTTGFGMSRNNTVPRATTPVTSEELFSSTPLLHLSNPMLQPFGQLHAAPPLHRYSMRNADSFNSSSLDGFVTSSPVLAQNPNHMPLRGDATFTSNQTNLQRMQQALFPGHQFGNNGFQSTSTNKENLAHVSQQLLERGLHQGQCSQQFYPGQLQKKQDHLLYEDTYRTQFATGLATPVKHGLSLEDYKEDLQKQNGFRPSNFQYQQNAVKDQYTSAQSSSSVHNSQLNSSPSIRSHPPQKQSASVQVQSSVQKAHQKQPASVQAQTQSSLKKTGRRQKQPASALVQTQSSQQKPHPPQKQSESVLVQTQSSLEKPHQKQPETAMVQTQSSLQKLHPPQKQSESVLVQTQSSLEKTHQKQPESVPIQMQLSQQKPHPHQKQPASVHVQTQSKPDPPQKQSASVVVKTQSSLQKPHLPQKQPESVLVQTQASVQKQTQISENNNGEREQIGVNLCQRTPMQPEALNRCSSAKPPINHQTVSPTRTAKRKRLPDGNNTSSRVVKGDNGRIGRYRRWILLMSHVCCCTAPKGKCESICFRAKETLKHAQHCKVPNCTYPNCLLTRESQHHFKQCREKSCCVCVYVKNFKKKHREASLRAAKPRFSSLQGRPRESSEFRQAYNKEVTEAPSVVDDLQPSIKRLKIKQPSQNATPQTESNSVSVCGVVCKSHSSMDVQAKKGLLSDECESVKAEVKPMDIYVSDASGIPVTKEVEKHVVEDTPKGKNGGEVKPMAIDVSNASGIPVTREVEKHVVEFTPKGKNGGEAMPMAIDVSDASRIPVTQEVEKHVVEFTPNGKNGGEVKPMEIDVSNASGIPVTREVEKHVVEDTSKGKNGGEVKPMAIDVSDASGIPVTREVEKHVVEDTPKGKKGGEVATDNKTVCVSGQGKSQCMNEMIASKEENVKQSVDASKMEISSLIELFTPYQVREHISGLRQWIGQFYFQSKIKADKNKAMSNEPLTENSCQLCAVQTLEFDPVPIYCTPCNVRIKRNASLYTVMPGETRHYVCVPCYNDARVKSVTVQGTPIPKASFEKKKNDDPAEEAWVQCDKCQSWQHQICALFNNRTNHGEATKYTCPRCYVKEVEKGERRPLSQNAIPGAISLPVTSLSNHLEQRLLKNLKKERQERARFQGKSYEEVPGAESLVVRVVASVDKVLEVNECFRELFREENYPSKFPYKSKVILLFQKIESVEVCLFGMFVQEFGTNSGPPNQRRVYISYLDSVKYFQPEVRTVSGEALRTFVYHEILIGYLDYCKKRGFTSCYIWACPPVKGDDYILYCHPEIQKMPKNDKLRDWYLAMLRKAAKEDVVVECTNLYDQFFAQSEECRANVTAARLPYFNGDCWPGIAAELLTQKSHEDDGAKLNRKGFTKNVIWKRALKAVGQSDLSVNASKDRVMMRKLGETFKSSKEDFIMVHLQHCCKHCCTLMISGNRWVCNQCKNFHICDNCYEAEQNRGDKERHPVNQKEKHTLFPVPIKDVPIEIEDKDANIESEFFDTREVFLNLCQRNNYQYDTLRRAKHSSMMLLYHLHNPTAPAFATICTICQQEVDNTQGWRCGVCPSYDVCNACYSKAPIEHPHNLISRSSTSNTVVQQNGKTNNQIQFEEMKQLLIHAPTCRTSQCQYPYCRNMLSLMRHCSVCKIGSLLCTQCKKFRDLIQQHAHFCRDSQCTVYKCRSFKAERSRTQEQSDKRRRAAVMKMMRERAAEATHTS